MQTDTGGDLCRVTMVAPRVRIDVALPTAVPLAGLLPTLLWHSGEDLAEEGLPHGGWALQRAAGPPLDTAATVAALGIRDGDTLYLRPRQDAMPAPVYDDTVDAIVSTLREQSRRWQPEHARTASLAAMGVVLLAGAAAMASLTTPRLAVASAAAVAAVLALLGAVAASRAFGNSQAGTVLGAGALPFAFLAGLDAGGPGAGLHSAGLHGVTPPQFLVGAGAFLITAAVAAVAVGDRGSLLTGALAAGTIAVGCSLLALFTSGAGAAAAAISIVLALSPAIAPVAYRLAGLPRPSVPATSEELRQRGEPIEAAGLARRAMSADRVVVALLAATGVVVVAAMIIMLTTRGWGSTALAALASCLLLLRSRLFTGTAQRGWLLGAGLAGTAVFSAVAAPRLGTLGTIAVVCGLAVVTAVLASVAISPGRRVAPSLRRATDLLELLGVIATIPLTLQVLHVFAMARSLAG